jgi:UDP-glucose:(heptosyl)LPS alpha-1,3-glucosyltransferase
MVKKDIIQRYKVPEDRIAVVYNGTDIERFHPRNRRYRKEIRGRHGIANEFVILFVSNNFRLKGLGFLMKALARIKGEGHSSFKLLILGRDRPKTYLRLARKLGLSEEVAFAGSTDEPEKYYGAADLLVHPTFYDACSLTVLEALASGIPVITTLSNGASGVIRSEEGRVIRDPKNSEELKEAIRYFLESEAKRSPLLQEGKKMEHYSDRVNFDQMMRVFREITPEC